MIAEKRKLFLQNVMTDAAGTVLSLQLHVVTHLCTCCCLAEQQCFCGNGDAHHVQCCYYT